MLIPILLFIVGLILLIKGGDWFVDGATGIAHRFHVPDLLIGATVVSIGTTLPEVMVSATSAVGGQGAMAYGNAIGSVICNTSLIAALTIAIKPAPVEKKSLRMPVAFFFAAALFYAITAYTTGYFSRVTGVLLLAGFVAYMIIQVKQALAVKGNKQGTVAAEEENILQAAQMEQTSTEENNSLVKDIILLIVGAALITVGANLLVDNGTILATKLEVPESVIALTLVALGTSLPELVTAITSLAKGHGALSLGNIIGANLFNLVLVGGVSVTLAPFQVPAEKTIGGMNASFVVDLPLMFLVMLIMTVPPLVKGKLYRIQGILLLLLYVGYCIFQFA